jgi:hypothetical protein
LGISDSWREDAKEAQEQQNDRTATQSVSRV